MGLRQATQLFSICSRRTIRTINNYSNSSSSNNNNNNNSHSRSNSITLNFTTMLNIMQCIYQAAGSEVTRALSQGSRFRVVI